MCIFQAHHAGRFALQCLLYPYQPNTCEVLIYKVLEISPNCCRHNRTIQCWQLRTMCPATAHTHSVYQILQTKSVPMYNHMLPQVTCRYTGLYKALPHVKAVCLWLAIGIRSWPVVHLTATLLSHQTHRRYCVHG